MVTDFWAWKHVAQAPRACVASTRLWRGVDSRWRTHVSLKSTGREGGLHSVLIEGLRRKCTESRSLFSGKKRLTRNSDWSPVV